MNKTMKQNGGKGGDPRKGKLHENTCMLRKVKLQTHALASAEDTVYLAGLSLDLKVGA